MLQTPVAKLILSLAAPTVASQLISIIYNTADTYFVSHISTSASAAVGVVFSLQSIIQAYGFGVAMGAGSLISLRLGEKKDRDANMYATSGFLAEFVGGLLMLVFGLLYLEPLIRVLGATETMLPHACAYGRIILMGAPIMCGSFILNCILRAEGAAVASMIGLCSGGILNIALDPLLIFTFGMGTAGAAVATVISQCMSFLVLAVAFLRGRSIVHLRPKYISRSPRDYVQILAVGFPTIARQGMASLASALMNIQGAVYGDAAVAALTISNKIYLLVRNVIIGIGQGFQPVAGYNYGAGDRERVHESIHKGLLIHLTTSALFSVIIFSGRYPMMHLFVGDDPTVIAIGAQVTALIAPCYVLFTLVEVLSATMRGVGDAVVPAAITMVFTCIVRLIYLWGYAFSHNSNLTIAVIYPISWVLTSIAFLLYYKSRKWMPKGFHF